MPNFRHRFDYIIKFARHNSNNRNLNFHSCKHIFPQLQTLTYSATKRLKISHIWITFHIVNGPKAQSFGACPPKCQRSLCFDLALYCRTTNTVGINAQPSRLRRKDHWTLAKNAAQRRSVVSSLSSVSFDTQITQNIDLGIRDRPRIRFLSTKMPQHKYNDDSIYNEIFFLVTFFWSAHFLIYGCRWTVRGRHDGDFIEWHAMAEHRTIVSGVLLIENIVLCVNGRRFGGEGGGEVTKYAHTQCGRRQDMALVASICDQWPGNIVC